MEQGAKRPRVLVIRGGAIGDFILTLPAIRLLRDNIPDAHIEILGYQPIIELAVVAGIADSTRSLEHAAMARLFVPEAVLDAALRDYFRSFNLVISYLFDPDGILRANMERIGVKTYLEASHEVTPGGGPAAEQLAKPLQRLAMFLDDPAPRIAVPVMAQVKKPIMALHPGSGSLKKNWPVENWIELGIDLAKSFPEREIALVTGEAEAERGITRKIIEAWGSISFHHWDQLPLVELASKLTSCQAFVGHDSGISHLAAACGLPCLLFFGPTDPAVWAPRGAELRIHAEPSGDLAHLGFKQARDVVYQFLIAR
ncbi:MAG: glycosyltransferase family 9 protein [Verrucomicrobia bacterium]|nr:glycosyltransferase family 9 protein [Verrucomicrobiota bacterium]